MPGNVQDTAVKRSLSTIEIMRETDPVLKDKYNERSVQRLSLGSWGRNKTQPMGEEFGRSWHVSQ